MFGAYINCKENKIKMKLLTILLVFTLILPITACRGKPESDSILCDDPPSALLGPCDDLGMEYIDSFIFFGESTTYHLKSRGVLSGGVNTKQVWAPPSATVNLDFTTKSVRIVYPETNEKLTVAEAAAKKRPKYLVMTFGLNGAPQKIKNGKEAFKRSYLLLIDSVRLASPETKIILQSAFPVAKTMDMSSYSVDAKTLNAYIDMINSWSLELATEEGLGYLNTTETLKDKNGFLSPEYDIGDGHHLTTEAYEAILTYIRTHGYK